MSYKVKEIFYTLQGEGHWAGRPAVFCRFTGCNLWSGREEDRSKAVCQFCDTDFVGMDGDRGGRYTAVALAEKVASLFPGGSGGARPFVVCTGGEPLLQLDGPLIDAFHACGLELAVETNGTVRPPAGIDWLCVSPKAGAELLVRSGDELKLVFPQAGAEPALYESMDFRHFYLQPMDSLRLAEHTAAALRYCMEHPRWSLSLQTHKILQIP